MSGHSWRNTVARAALVAALAAITVFAIPGTVRADTYPSNPTVEWVPAPGYYNPLPVPSGWRPACTTGPQYGYGGSTCPVLVWGNYTYWVYSPSNNSWSEDIVAYDQNGNIVKQVVVGGDRYIWNMTVDDNAQTVTIYTQGYYQPTITVSWADLYVNPQVATSTSVSFGSGPFPYTGSAYTATATVTPSGSGDASIAYTGDCTDAGNTCTATATYAGDSGHQSSSGTATITIDPAPLTVTASSGTMTYGGSVPAVTAQASGLVGTDTLATLGSGLTCSTTATSTSDPGTYPTTCSGASDANYDISYAAGSIVVSPATPTAPTISNLPASGIYGGGFTAAVATNGDGATSVTSSTPSVCTVGSDGATVSYVGTGTCTLTAHVAAGTDYLAGDGNPQSFDVQKATPTLTWAAPAQILYGTALGSTQLDATASTPGTFSYAPAAGTVLTPGSSTLTATFTPTDTADWNGGTVSTAIDVGFSNPCITGLHVGVLRIGAGEAVCLGSGARVAGPIRVDGGSLWIDGAHVLALLDSTHATAIGICGADVAGLVSITSSTGPVVVGDGASCAGNHIVGPVSIQANTGGVSFVGNTDLGPVVLRDNSGGFAYSGNTVHGPVRLSNNS